ncbi:hypothetical protein LENED_007419 [Lentinula edodes]|uniref:Uncharacterized protein n=1 Tax=Lentinula edodes TaxID=5353 RepID=A0A1Q3EED9_LENED|nr:hypothetical protein LENED_007419 [Lentinula edodes]
MPPKSSIARDAQARKCQLYGSSFAVAADVSTTHLNKTIVPSSSESFANSGLGTSIKKREEPKSKRVAEQPAPSKRRKEQKEETQSPDPENPRPRALQNPSKALLWRIQPKKPENTKQCSLIVTRINFGFEQDTRRCFVHSPEKNNLDRLHELPDILHSGGPLRVPIIAWNLLDGTYFIMTGHMLCELDYICCGSLSYAKVG